MKNLLHRSSIELEPPRRHANTLTLLHTVFKNGRLESGFYITLPYTMDNEK